MRAGAGLHFPTSRRAVESVRYLDTVPMNIDPGLAERFMPEGKIPNHSYSGSNERPRI